MPTKLTSLTILLEAHNDLTATQVTEAATRLANPDIPLDDKASFLTALAEKGETVTEVTAFAEVFRGLARDPGLSAYADRAIDIVGTGGSRSGGYNVSTVSAFVVAACGVPVLKHGNRAITSQSGSADFLSVAGVKVSADVAVLKQSVEALNFCFFFAPAFHPAFKHIMPVRKALAAEGQRTIFNILGPLINPAKPKRQLLGVFAPQWVKPLAESLTALGMETGLAACATLPDNRRMDELASVGSVRVAGIGAQAAINTTWQPTDFGFTDGVVDDLNGGTPADNLALFQTMLEGKAPATLVDTICFNAGAALHLAGAAADWKAGIAQAREALVGGTVANWYAKAREFYADVEALTL